MTDKELVDKIVKEQVDQIKLQKQYKNNPLAMPPLTKEKKEQMDKEWREAVSRGLHHEIHRLIGEQV